jgi:hypothetical protein
MDKQRSFREFRLLVPVNTTERLSKKHKHLKSPVIKAVAVVELGLAIIYIIAQVSSSLAKFGFLK